MNIFIKPETINITLKGADQPTKTITAIVSEKSETEINKLKKEVNEQVIPQLTEDTKSSVYIQYRLNANKRVGSVTLKTNKSVEEVYAHFMSLQD